VTLTTGLIGITLGDPAGIGPELVVKAWRGGRRFVAIGPASALLDCDPSLPVVSWQPGAPLPDHQLPLLQTEETGPFVPGAPDDASARAAWQALEQAAALALRGALAGVVTAPVAKANLYAIGFRYPGQTEFFADRCGVADADMAMMLAGPALRTVPVTIHLPLKSVPKALTTDLIVRRARVTLAALARDFGLAQPRLAVSGLNPHAGERGTIGHEDAAVIAPAIAQLQAQGHAVSGPHPADTLFAAHARAGYDAALAMYHDQALIPVKALDFDRTVNLTLGLPILRTSPDHGTAFDIAGQGIARPDSLMAAFDLAAECSARRAAV
jgi:4-hydroxythreonine-4-phosphate dehydrogenase